MGERLEPCADDFEVHVLKTWPGPFEAVRARKKKLEIRRADRNFKEGDTLWLEEYDPDTDMRSGEVEVRIVTHVLPGGQFGIEPGFVAMSIDDIPADRARSRPMPDVEVTIKGELDHYTVTDGMMEAPADELRQSLTAAILSLFQQDTEREG